jgi:hypothetical protein
MEDRKEELIKELIRAIKRGRDPSQIVAAWEREHQDKFENEDALEDFFDEILSEAMNASTGHSDSQGEKDELIKKINKWLRYFKYGSRVKLITYEEIHEIDASRVIPNMSNIRNRKLDDIEEDLFEILGEIDRLKMTGHKKLQDIFDELDNKLSVNVPNEDGLKRLSMGLKEYYKQLGELDVTLANDREKMYSYWGEVADVYTTLVNAITEFKDAVKSSRADASVKKLVEQLNIPPPYIKKLDKVTPAESRGVNTRLLQFIEEMSGQKSPKRTSYEMEHQPRGRQKVGDEFIGEEKELPFLSQKTPAETPMTQDSKEKSTTSTWLSGEQRNLMEDFEEL